MNHCVPEFNMDDEDYSLPSASGLPRQKNVQEDEIMELLWQNGQVVVQSQNPRLLRKSSPPPTKLPHHHPHQTPSQSAAALPPPTRDSTAQLFMHEDEMISWLQYPLEDPPFDRDLIDLFYHSPMPPSSSAAAALKPPPPPPPSIVHPNHQIPIPSRPEAPPAGLNFPYFSRMTTRFPDSGPSTSSRNNDLRDSTVVDSSDTPAVVQKSKINLPRRNTMEASGLGNRGCNSFSGGGGGTVGGTSTAGGGCMSISMSRDGETCELTLTSSPGGSGASATATADLMTLPPSVDRKRKGREPVDDATTEYQSEDVEIESCEEKKQARGANTKRSRAAEVHNQSERRRRDRINEKMKALQELIPRCSKTDKASMLDEAIEYLKSLQMQVQMMSMGCGMVPVMFPGVQQYMPSMGMGMGMTRHMMPFPAVLSGSGLPAPGAQMNPRFPFQAFPMQQTSNQADASVNPLGMPNLADPYSHQYIGIQHMPMQIPQTQPTSQPGTRQPSTSRGDQDDEKHQTG